MTYKQLKRDIITFLALIAILLCCATAKAQTHLPDTITVKLSPRDLLAISTRIDSLQQAFATSSVLPANQVTSFNQRLNIALSVMYSQIQRQLVADKPKEIKRAKKP